MSILDTDNEQQFANPETINDILRFAYIQIQKFDRQYSEHLFLAEQAQNNKDYWLNFLNKIQLEDFQKSYLNDRATKTPEFIYETHLYKKNLEDIARACLKLFEIFDLQTATTHFLAEIQGHSETLIEKALICNSNTFESKPDGSWRLRQNRQITDSLTVLQDDTGRYKPPNEFGGHVLTSPRIHSGDTSFPNKKTEQESEQERKPEKQQKPQEDTLDDSFVYYRNVVIEKLPPRVSRSRATLKLKRLPQNDITKCFISLHQLLAHIFTLFVDRDFDAYELSQIIYSPQEWNAFDFDVQNRIIKEIKHDLLNGIHRKNKGGPAWYRVKSGVYRKK